VGEVGAVIAIVFAVLIFGTRFGRELNPLGRELKYLSYDIPFFARPQVDVSEAVIIYMDGDSYTKLNQIQERGKWDRGLHVQLLERLKELGAKAIVFDILFDEHWVDEPTLKEMDRRLQQVTRNDPHITVKSIPADEVDRRFGTAARDHEKVVVVVGARMKLVKTGTGDLSAEPIRPVDAIATNAFWGVTEFELQKGLFQGIRLHNPDQRFTSMAQATAVALGGNAPPPPRWINYYGPAGTIQAVSYYQLFQADAIRTNQFAGKIVFVGMGRIITPRGESRDDFPTPYNLVSTNPRNTQGVEIQATACLNYLKGDSLTELARSWQIALFVVCGGLFGLLFALVRPWVAVITAIFAFGGVVYAGVQTVWQTHIWFSWAIIALVQIPAALGWALLINTRQLYRDKVALERKLATVTSTPPATTPATEAATVVAHDTVIAPRPDVTRQSPEWLAQANDLIADHQLVRCVGEGSYGQVWLARNVIGTYTAIKLVYRSKFKDDAPFDREFHGLKRFMPVSRGHPGLVQILHVGKTQEYFYYVMEAGDDETTQQAINPETYVPRNLSGDLQKRAKLPASECLKLAIDLSAALDYLHQRQLIHRDIKPSNIIFVNGQPKIADIGLVTVIATSPRTDATYIGTPGYIPPEGPGTAAADVYSLGKVIYEASMGRHVAKCPDLPTSLIERSDYKALLELNEIVIKAAADNVQFRYQSAADLHADLVQLQVRLAKSLKLS